MVGPCIYSLGPIASILLKLCAQVHLLVLRVTIITQYGSTVYIGIAMGGPAI